MVLTCISLVISDVEILNVLLFVCRFIDDGHSDRCEMILHCGFNLHFSDD